MIQNEIPFHGEVIESQSFQTNILYTLNHNGINYMVKRTPIREGKKMELTLNEFLSQPQGKHPNIIEVYDIKEQYQYIYIKMEYSEAGSIENMKFTPHLLHQLIVEIIAALQHLGKFNIFHRDLKPQNIVYINGHFKLIDFGSAKYYVLKNISQLSSYIGSLPFMSPQVYLKKEYSNLCDIWSLGATLYNLIYSQTIWDTMGIYKERQIKEAFEKILQNNAGIPYPKCEQPGYIEYQQIVKKMLAPHEQNRITLEQLELQIKQIEYQRTRLYQNSTIMATIEPLDYNQIPVSKWEILDNNDLFESLLKKYKKNTIESVLILWGYKRYLENIENQNVNNSLRKIVGAQFLHEYNCCPDKDQIDLFDEEMILELIENQLNDIYKIIY